MSDFGFDELNKLAADMTELADIIPREAKKSVQQAAIETKKDWARDASKGPGRRYSPTIDYTEREYGGFGQGVYEAEIGPNLARYGGKTGKGGLVPSLGFLDDPESTGGIRATPSRARRRAEKFAEKIFPEKLEKAVDESHRKLGL